MAIGEPALPERLHAQLQQVARSLNLLRIAMAAQDRAAARAMQVQATLTPAGGSARGIDAWLAAEARDGDVVAVEVRNTGRRAVDLTALYIDAAHGITVLYPLPAGASNRIEAGDRDRVVARIDSTTRGVEHLLLIAVESRPQADRRDFSFLAQPRLGTSRAVADDATRLLQRAAFGEAGPAVTRGAGEAQAVEALDLRIYRLDVR
jgi:hypothetical protein